MSSFFSKKYAHIFLELNITPFPNKNFYTMKTCWFLPPGQRNAEVELGGLSIDVGLEGTDLKFSCLLVMFKGEKKIRAVP